MTLAEFWDVMQAKYSELSEEGVNILIPFASSY
jgi:hypothetical protein